MNLTLHALPDDWNLNALYDTPRSTGGSFPFLYYLTDTAGNKLTDTAGNYLVAYNLETLYPQILHSIPDDFTLNAE